MTDVIERARAALKGITPGPWTRGREIDGVNAGRWTVVFAPFDGAGSVAKRVVTVDQTRKHHTAAAEANIAFIADAPGLVRELVAEVERLRTTGPWMEQVEYVRAMKRERDGECICNTGPEIDGPDECCPWHGRSYNELLEMLTKGKIMTDENSEVRELRWRIRQLGKQNGRQGETIHRLRAELAEMREMNGRIQRGELRDLDRAVAALHVTRQLHVDTIATLREKLSGEAAEPSHGFGSAYSGGSDV